jgi:hypothetical protein
VPSTSDRHFGSVSDHTNLRLNIDSIEFVKDWKYFGTTIVSGKQFSFSARADLHSFYKAFNSIANVLNSDEIVLMKLLYTNCVSIFSYACSVKKFSSSEMTECNMGWEIKVFSPNPIHSRNRM